MPPTPTAIPAGFTKFILDPCTRPPGTSDTELRAELEALEWFGDNPSSGDQSLDEDVAVWEEDTIEVLERMLAQCPKVFRAVVASEWMRNDELDITWARMVSANYILQLARVDEQSAVAILELPFLETMEPLDGFTLEFLRDVFRTDPYEGRRLIADPTIGDPATASLPTDFYLTYLRLEGPAVSQALDSIRWIGDGVDPFWDPMKNYRDINSSYEADALQNLTILYLKSPEAFLSLARRPWLQESISPDNYTALSNVLDFAYDSPEMSARVAEMAFLDTFEEGDLMIVQTMLEIADNDPGRLEEILANPDLADGLVHGRR